MRTNRPGTCLYCGKVLPRSRWDYVWPDGSRHGYPPVGGMRAEVVRVRVQLPEEARGLEGLFHSGSCAQAFGRAAARNGYRLAAHKLHDGAA